MAKDNIWDDDYDANSSSHDYLPRQICGGTFHEEEKTNSSINWEKAISSFFTIGGIAIVGHLIQMWWK
jgi:hypothetical protein